MDQGITEPLDLQHVHWSYPEAIAANPARSLANADLAMDYFAYSYFFDSGSNNNILRTQRRVENPAYGHAEEKYELNHFTTGFEYIVAHAKPPELFVIHRRDVLPDNKRAAPSAAWFILQDRIYPCPTLYGVMSARLRNASHLVSSTFNTLSASHPAANPRSTSQWRSLPPSVPGQSETAQAKDAADGEDTTMADASSTSEPTARTKATAAKAPDFHLFNALQSTRIALGELDKMAATPAKAVDPKEELRAIEARIMGSKEKTHVPKATGVQIRTTAGTPSVRVAGSPAVSMAGAGRAQSVGTSAMGQSPAVR